MEENKKMATLIKEGQKPRVVEVDSPDAKQAFSEGFSLPDIKQVTAAPEVTADVKKPEVINRESLLSNIQQSVDKFGVKAGANEAFIQGVSKLATGKAATPEEIAKGGTIGDVVERFGVAEKLSGFGMDKPEPTMDKTFQTEPFSQPDPKSAQERIQDLLQGFGTEKQKLIQTEQERLGVDTLSKAIGEAQTDVANAQTTLENLNVAQLTEGKEFYDRFLQQKQGSGATLQSINAEISNKLQDLSTDQKLEAIFAQNNLNNALAKAQIAQGNYDRAQELVQASADTLYNNFQFQLEALKQQGAIEEAEAGRLNEQALFERDMALNGRLKISDPEQLKELTEEQIMRVPNIITGGIDIYRRSDDEIAQETVSISPEAQALANQVSRGVLKMTNVPSALRGEVALALGDTRITQGGGTVSGGGVIIPKEVEETVVEKPTLEEYAEMWMSENQMSIDQNELINEYNEFLLDLEKKQEPIINNEVKGWLNLLNKGQAKISNVPQDIRNMVVSEASRQDVQFNKQLSDSAIKEITQSQKALDELDTLESVLNQNLEYLGPISGYQSLNPWSESRKVLSDIDRVRQSVGKALEGGVLRKEDEEKYKKILATITDTPDTAIYKIQSLRSTIEKDIENYKNNQQMSGRFVGDDKSIITSEEARNKYGY